LLDARSAHLGPGLEPGPVRRCGGGADSADCNHLR
jgi:hypothetical protein